MGLNDIVDRDLDYCSGKVPMLALNGALLYSIQRLTWDIHDPVCPPHTCEECHIRETVRAALAAAQKEAT
jgi:hypothetical protein